MTPENIMNTLKENIDFVLSNHDSATRLELISKHMNIQDCLKKLTELNDETGYFQNKFIELLDFLKNEREKLNEQHED